MSRFFLWFYCQNLWTATFLVLSGTALLALACDRFRPKWLLRTVLIGLLTLWAAAVLYTTLGIRTPSDPKPACWIPFQSYRNVYHGANPELLRSNFMNVLLFFPAGALLAALVRNTKKHRLLAAFGVILLGLFSFGIELMQMRYHLGWPEADDVVHNLIGAWMGIVVCRFLMNVSAQQSPL